MPTDDRTCGAPCLHRADLGCTTRSQPAHKKHRLVPTALEIDPDRGGLEPHTRGCPFSQKCATAWQDGQGAAGGQSPSVVHGLHVGLADGVPLAASRRMSPPPGIYGLIWPVTWAAIIVGSGTVLLLCCGPWCSVAAASRSNRRRRINRSWLLHNRPSQESSAPCRRQHHNRPRLRTRNPNSGTEVGSGMATARRCRGRGRSPGSGIEVGSGRSGPLFSTYRNICMIMMSPLDFTCGQWSFQSRSMICLLPSFPKCGCHLLNSTTV